MKKKSQKPIEHDIHLKYVCLKCLQPHWLSFKEAQTKNFKVVCDCGRVFGVKRVKAFKIKYYDDAPKIKKNKSKEEDDVPLVKKEIPIDFLKEGSRILVGYGFTPDEADSLLRSTFEDNSELTLAELIKKSLESLKGKI